MACWSPLLVPPIALIWPSSPLEAPSCMLGAVWAPEPAEPEEEPAEEALEAGGVGRCEWVGV